VGVEGVRDEAAQKRFQNERFRGEKGVRRSRLNSCTKGASAIDFSKGGRQWALLRQWHGRLEAGLIVFRKPRLDKFEIMQLHFSNFELLAIFTSGSDDGLKKLS
jgi:hypothetical protein